MADKHKSVMIRLPKQLCEDIKKLAENQERTVSSQIRYILKMYLLKN